MGFTKCKNFLFVLIRLCLLFPDVGTATDTITSSQFTSDPEIITSRGGDFTLGFFTPQNSTKRYVGIWCKSQTMVAWVANRNRPLNDSSGVVTISEDGNLVVLNGHKQVIWSTNVSNVGSNSTCKLLDSGNLVLQDSTTGSNIWESFQHPSNALLANMKLRTNKVTGERVKLTSWKSPSDPSTGSFSFSVERLSIPEGFIWNESHPFWRTGPWNERTFTGLPNIKTHYLSGLHVGDDGQGNVELYFTKVEVRLTITVLNSQGNLVEKVWNEEKKEWCLKGFEPMNEEECNRQNWTSGCVRRKPLQCEIDTNQNTSADHKTDGFFKLALVKVPDFADGSNLTLQPDTCRSRCLENCTCVAYSHDAEIGYKQRNRTVIISIIVTIGIALIFVCAYITWRRISNHHGGAPAKATGDDIFGDLSQEKLQELLIFNFEKLVTSTNNFHPSNKLGQGGFGPVYKGHLQDGQEIAVKRLSRASGQGLEEFMNEVVVISKLQHRNLINQKVESLIGENDLA